MFQSERNLAKLRNEQGELGVDISSDEEGNHWDQSLDAGIEHPPLKKVRVDEEGNVRSSSKTPRDKLGVKNPEVICCLLLEHPVEVPLIIMMIQFCPFTMNIMILHSLSFLTN